MKPAYVILDTEITDPEPFKEYQQHVLAIIERYGGKFIARGGRFELLENRCIPNPVEVVRIGILGFPSYEQAKAWYESPEYQALLPSRTRNTRSNFVILTQGLERG